MTDRLQGKTAFITAAGQASAGPSPKPTCAKARA